MSSALDNSGLGNIVDPTGIGRKGLDILTGKGQAEAAGRMAEAQLAQQRADRAAAQAAAEPSPQELAQMQRSIDLNSQDIARKEKLLASADPAMIESGKQALRMLQGHESSVVNPLKQQRQQQRRQLEQTLQQRLGAGYASSSAGIQALNQFDQQTAAAVQGSQQQALSGLLGISHSISGQGLQSNIANSAAIAGLYGNQAARRVGAITGAPINAAGAQYMQQMMEAKGQTALAGNLLSLGATFLGGPAAGGAAKIATSGMSGGMDTIGGISPTAGTGYLGKDYTDFGV